MIEHRIPEPIRQEYALTIEAAIAWMRSGVTNTFRLPVNPEDRAGIAKGTYIHWLGDLVRVNGYQQSRLGRADLETLLLHHSSPPIPAAVITINATTELRRALLADMARHRPYLTGEKDYPVPIELH